MITVSKIIQLTGDGPFEYAWSSSNACASFSKPSGTTTGTVECDITFATAGCFATAVITLTVFSACGTSSAQVITVANPCATFQVNGPTVTGGFVFSASATGSTCANATFDWVFDTSLFSLVSNNTSGYVSTITLALRKQNPPTSSPITVKIGDCKNCEATSTLTYLFCSPVIPAKTVYLYSDSNIEDFISSETQMEVSPGCNTFTPNWNTLTFTLPAGMTASNNGTGKVTYVGTSGTEIGTYQGLYSVKSTLGVSAQQGNITFVLSRPSSSSSIVVQDSIFTLSCDQIAGTVVDVPLNYYVSPNSSVDWNSFQVLTPPTPKSTSIVLGFDAGGNRVIKYTVPNLIDTDTFSFLLCDTYGNCSSAASTSVIGCTPPPTATNDSYSVVCGSTTDFQVLLNDNGNGSPLVANSLVVSVAPTHGTISVANGIVSYTADSNYAGSDFFKYRVSNAKGAQSNEATVTITTICAGTNVNVTICN